MLTKISKQYFVNIKQDGNRVFLLNNVQRNSTVSAILGTSGKNKINIITIDQIAENTFTVEE